MYLKLIRQAQSLAKVKAKREEEVQKNEASLYLLETEFSQFAGLEDEDAVKKCKSHRCALDTN